MGEEPHRYLQPVKDHEDLACQDNIHAYALALPADGELSGRHAVLMLGDLGEIVNGFRKSGVPAQESLSDNAAARPMLVVDCSSVDHMHSAVASKFSIPASDMYKSGGALYLVGVKPEVEKIFRQTQENNNGLILPVISRMSLPDWMEERQLSAALSAMVKIYKIRGDETDMNAMMERIKLAGDPLENTAATLAKQASHQAAPPPLLVIDCSQVKEANPRIMFPYLHGLDRTLRKITHPGHVKPSGHLQLVGVRPEIYALFERHQMLDVFQVTEDSLDDWSAKVRKAQQPANSNPTKYFERVARTDLPQRTVAFKIAGKLRIFDHSLIEAIESEMLTLAQEAMKRKQNIVIDISGIEAMRTDMTYPFATVYKALKGAVTLHLVGVVGGDEGVFDKLATAGYHRLFEVTKTSLNDWIQDRNQGVSPY